MHKCFIFKKKQRMAYAPKGLSKLASVLNVRVIIGAGKDCRHYMPRVSAACVAAASSQAGGGGSASGGVAAAANAPVLFDRTMQNVVDKLFPHFAIQERLEEQELQRYMQHHQHKQLPPEYSSCVMALGSPLKREAVAQRRSRLEARVAAGEALEVYPLEPPVPQQEQAESQQPAVGADAPLGATQKDQLKPSRAHGRSVPQPLQQPLDEFVDQVLGSPTCFDEQQTTAVALLPDPYQGQLMQARLQHQATGNQGHFQHERTPAKRPLHELHGVFALPLKLPSLERPYLRVPSRMSVQLVLRYLASQLQPLLVAEEPFKVPSDTGVGDGKDPERSEVFWGAGVPHEQKPDLEMALELTLEGRVLGRSHSIDFVRKARRLNCAGKCLLLQYRYTAQTETKVIAYHLAKAKRHK